MDSDPAMVRYSNINLRILISLAYRFDSDRVLGGPDWIGSQGYDLAAKIPAGASRRDIPAMLQALLAERFKLTVHRESKEQRVYFLVVGENGLKAKEAEGAESADVQQVRGDRVPMQIVRGGIRGRSVTLAVLAGALARAAGAPVIDRTGVTRKFDIDLNWTPEDAGGYAPEIFAAVQKQLGLKLEPGRAPIEMLVVDHAERVPLVE